MLDRMLLKGADSDGTLYVEDVFSVDLWNGNGDVGQTITNGIDLAGKGGLVWAKTRSLTDSYNLADTARGGGAILATNLSNGSIPYTDVLPSFTTTGFNTGDNLSLSSRPYVSWSFRKAAKFFDIVTYTGNGANRTIPHSLGVAPGCIIVKRTDTTGDWEVYHRSLANTEYLLLNSTAAKATGTNRWNSTTATASQFSLGNVPTVNAPNGSYVAYLFAHDETADGIIECGSYTGNGSASGPIVSLGWEPQFILIKNQDAAKNWCLFDNMRGIPTGQASYMLRPNTTDGDQTSLGNLVDVTPTGFQLKSTDAGSNASGNSYIYIAIRRGPMKAPTVGTSVFAPVARSGTGANATVSAGFVTDAVIEGNRASSTAGTKFGAWDRLRGLNYLITNTTAAEASAATTIIQANPWDVVDGYKVGTTSTLTNASGNTFINWMFRRAPGFFDVVCYTGTGVARTVDHNLGVEPELMIVKARSASANWFVYAKPMVNLNYHLNFNRLYSASSSATVWNTTAPTASAFTVGTANSAAGTNYVAYLFASCPGVSKIGKYTGDGGSQTIDCGFSNGARFVMVKRYDSDGDWFIWDTARGIVAANDPHLSPNNATAEVTTDDSVDPASVGFAVNQVAATNINVNGASYIYLAIA